MSWVERSLIAILLLCEQCPIWLSNARSGRHQFKINSVANGANIKHRYGPKHFERCDVEGKGANK